MTNLDKFRQLSAEEIASYFIHEIERPDFDYDWDERLYQRGTYTEYYSDFLDDFYDDFDDAREDLIKYLNSEAE